MLRSILIVIVIFGWNNTFAQFERKYSVNENTPEWVKLMYQESADPGEVIKEHDAYFAGHSEVKNCHTQYYKRWLRSFSRTVTFDVNSKQDQDYINNSLALKQEKGPNSAWNCIGPYDFDKDAASRSYACGAAHVYTVERSESDTTIMFAGSATAGVWKSTNSGVNWSLVTQDLLIGGTRAIEIDHSNPDIAYFGSSGNLYKTLDGGSSWSIIGDAAFQADNHGIQDIVMSPTNSNEIYLTSDYGFYRTTDGGMNWTQIMSGEFQEIELNPTDPTMLYLIKVNNFKTEFYRSMNSGLSFTQQTNGWPNPTGVNDHQERVEIAVTPANSNLIYANATGSANGGSGTYGIYISSDQGTSWTFQCCGSQPAGPPADTNMNLMGWSKFGTDDGGQYYYDVALEVDPVNENKLYLGGVNHWISEDAGVTWTCPAKWSEPAEPGYVHADIHDIRFLGSELWFACDGGVFKSTDGAATVNKSMVGIEGTDFWGFGSSPQSDVMLGGAYHNGTLLKDNNTYLNDWICTGGGDGVRGFVNFGNDRIAYDDYEGRILSGDRTVNIQGFQFDSLPNASYIVGESSDMAWDPRNYNHIYLGRGKNLIKTEDNGLTYSLVFAFSDRVMAVEIARSNLDFMYVTTYADWWGAKKIWKTTDRGVSWTEITPSNALLVNEFWVPYDITVSATDENTIWAARTSQYNSYPNLNGKQVYKSIDGGVTWTNYGTPILDGEWISNIVHQAGTDGGVYVGTRRGVYYRNNSMNDWALFNNNLPLNTNSTRLAFKYKDKLLRNATNRSVYEVETYDISQPIAQIAADQFNLSCLNNTVQFVDHSVLSSDNASWQWSFSGGTPSSSTAQNPLVVYANPGSYDVSLTVTDDYGTDTQTYTAFIEYLDDGTPLDFSEDFETGITTFWSQQNANNSFGWSENFLNNGPECTPTKCVWINHYDINEPGDQAELITSKIELFPAVSAELTFDYAYAKWGGSYEDGFRIDISTDCWVTYDTLFLAYGDSLETVDDMNSFWVPQDCADWSLGNSIDISAYIGNNIMIRFVGINGWGNNFFMDNVNILGGNTGNQELDEVNVAIYPNPASDLFYVEHNLNNPELVIFNMDGKEIHREQLSQYKEVINLKLDAGVYHVRLISGALIINEKISIH